ncbi:MAG: hypothetical protein WBJ68_14035 [Candidatus Dechloromonas phosphoritropha]|jgi:hypothetical protein
MRFPVALFLLALVVTLGALALAFGGQALTLILATVAYEFLAPALRNALGAA